MKFLHISPVPTPLSVNLKEREFGILCVYAWAPLQNVSLIDRASFDIKKGDSRIFFTIGKRLIWRAIGIYFYISIIYLPRIYIWLFMREKVRLYVCDRLNFCYEQTVKGCYVYFTPPPKKFQKFSNRIIYINRWIQMKICGFFPFLAKSICNFRCQVNNFV